ncbi:helix-turn-helix domain-containing protein [Streptomyces sp. UNOC14_S4]|uniref:helix-turn-helix domain-containing protein n=1 Tax=Streptomyces sp. UNOC14_S4 TaxID=2872340 RepID=UPI001E2F46AA|nr:helix-turn-helix domain-containing protein [Streptomyces sp. UNOC14_S4]MCC3767963.1 helix-turn-helix domain-containing protein [Streptomyces sp. UNOC14_S4]
MSGPTCLELAEAPARTRPLPAVFEGMSLPVRSAAELLGLTPWTVTRLIDRGVLQTVHCGPYRYVTLTSVMAYRRLGRS